MNTYDIFNIHNEDEFNQMALTIYHFQKEHNKVYREFLKVSHHYDKPIQHYSEIVSLPIEFFKTQKVIVEQQTPQLVFESKWNYRPEDFSTFCCRCRTLPPKLPKRIHMVLWRSSRLDFSGFIAILSRKTQFFTCFYDERIDGSQRESL